MPSSAEETHRDRKQDEDPQKSLLTDQLISHLMENNDDQLLKELNQILGFMNHRSCLKESSLLDFYFCGFLWMKRMEFSVRQTSFLMSLLHLMINNLQGKQMELLENILEFIEALTDQCLTSEEETLVLDTEEACALISYLKKSLFQKYKMYQLLFRTHREELLIGAQRDVEVFSCLSVPPLEEGLPVHLSHLKMQ